MAEEKILDRVAKLLALAEHPNTPAPEAEIALLQANRLIAKHAIEEAVLRQHQTVGERRALVRRDINLGGGHTFRPYLRTVLGYAAETNRVSVATLGETASMFGADEDVAWVDMLFNMIKLQFLSKINPTWDKSKSYDENVYTFKVAGYKWAQINAEAIKNNERDARKWVEQRVYVGVGEDAVVPHYYPEGRIVRMDDEYGLGYAIIETPENKLSGILIAAYKRWAKAVGDDAPVSTQDFRSYRLSYAEAFRATMRSRFVQMMKDAEEERDTIPGAALALRDLKVDADQAMYDAFPNLSPEEVKKRRQEEYERQQREAAERQAKLDAMTDKQREKFLEAEERERRRNQKYWDAYQDRNAIRHDAGARRRGERAAESVDLSRKAGYAEQGSPRQALS